MPIIVLSQTVEVNYATGVKKSKLLLNSLFGTGFTRLPFNIY